MAEFEIPLKMRRIFEKPGFIKGDEAKVAREMYQEYSLLFNPVQHLSHFGLLCYLGVYEDARKLYDGTSQPDLKQSETPYNWGYISLAVAGSQRVVESPRPVHHVDLISWLLSKGAPVNLPDIAGLTALHHVVMNNRVEGILIALLKGGANPNAQDKYGDLPLHHAMMCGQAEAVEALLEYGADLTIREPNDCAPIDILLGCVPEVHAVVQKWQLKQAGITAPLEAGRRVCVVCGKEGKSQCAKCRVVRYCSRECQEAHWKSGHKAECIPFSGGNILVFKPVYGGLNSVMSLSGFKRGIQGQPDGEATRNKRSDPKAKSLGKDDKVQSGKSMLIKVQLPPGGGLGAMLVYNRTRTFMCQLLERNQPQAYKALSKVIQERGTLGLKGYFTAELLSQDQLAIKAADILASQPW